MKMLSVILAVCSISWCQELSTVKTICVTWPRGNSQDARLERAEVSRQLEKLGRKTVNCWDDAKADYDAQLWFYPYGGTVTDSTTYFAIQTARSRNTVVGSLATWHPAYPFAGWMLTLWPRGRYLSIYRDEKAATLEAGLRRLSRVLNKAQKHRK